MKGPRIVVLIPCKNEELSIDETIREARMFLPEAEFVVADNASTDGTAVTAARSGAKVIAEGRPGKGFALRRLFADVEADIYCMVDGDATYSPRRFAEMVHAVDCHGFDVAIGVREVHSNNSRSGHALGNSLITKFFEKLFAISIEDSLSGMRVMSRRYVKTFATLASGFEIETDLNVHAASIEARIFTVPVEYRPRAEGSASKLRTYRDGLRILRRMLNLFIQTRPRTWYALLALPWLIFSIFLIERVLRVYFSSGNVTNFPSLIAGTAAFLVAAVLLIAGLITNNSNVHFISNRRLQFLSLPYSQSACTNPDCLL